MTEAVATLNVAVPKVGKTVAVALLMGLSISAVGTYHGLGSSLVGLIIVKSDLAPSILSVEVRSLLLRLALNFVTQEHNP